ncbi:unnamed protein product [Parascedosporium putredinis]|uniref:Centrosomin N-terminal motif 1 domain-containing protein n=1 Tax=Parascedosporium putredinis TaxID=1442378 RepID=A0A9P1H9Z2_9PEZI|nr:unnamed protein product [Parascedosporium putredinis]CAI8004091.1 unnamed protein product [Parascedosporium putredinis]
MSSGGPDAPTKKKGMGVKEMEQTVSTLHKQNFDLKLELYHRRERQTALEDELTRMKDDSAQLTELNDRLVEELEKRDKAVEEAVAMIVLLEAQVETLLKEREMVRHFASLQRMPSFLSEQSQTTENLRNVYLGAKGGSLLSLLRPTETPVDIEHERLASPSLSVLSESSFVSVYGKHNGQDGDMTITQFDERPTLETHSPGGASYPPLTDMLDQNSPLQRLEKMDRTYSLKTTSSQQSGRDREAEYQRAAGAPTTLSRTASQRRTKEQKREALKKVMTDAPGRLRDQNMPPTPDTISTTTLRHYQNSADTLSQQQGLAHQQSYLTLSETNSVPSLDAQPGPRARTVIPANFAVAQPPSMTAFHSRRDAPRSSYFDNRPPSSNGPEDESDANSMASSLDIWMKDSWKPAKSYGNGGRRSPDLFGFPAKGVTGLTSPWSPEAIFNAAFAKPSTTGGGGINSALDGLVPAETALFGSGVPPPPPPALQLARADGLHFGIGHARRHEQERDFG